MWFALIYLKTWGDRQLYVAFSTLEFSSCCFVFGRIFTVQNSLTLYKPCLLWLVSSLFSCLMDGTCLPCLAVKMVSGEGSLMMWGGSVCCKPLRTPCKPVDYRYSRSTTCIVIPLCEVCTAIMSVSLTLSRNVLLF